MCYKKAKQTQKRPAKRFCRKVEEKGERHNRKQLNLLVIFFVFTTLPEKLVKPSVVLEIYRGRWQIELVFKRLKSIIGLGHLPKQDPVGAKAWIHGKLFAAFLIEALISAGERFFLGDSRYQLKSNRKRCLWRGINDVAINKSSSKSPCWASEMH